MAFSEIFAEIADERARQDRQWGGAAHDDEHSDADWYSYIRYQGEYVHDQIIPTAFEERMIKIAALAVAAVESSRRKRAK
jgi:hypothetical protein